MTTFYLAIMFICNVGTCGFIMPTQQVYSSEAKCWEAINGVERRVKEALPEVIGQKACIALKLVEV